MDQLPISAILAILVVALLATVELGYPIGRWFRQERGLDKYPMESSASNTVLGLLASSIIIISFSAVLVMIIDLDRPIRTLFRHAGDPTAEALLEKMEADHQP